MPDKLISVVIPIFNARQYLTAPIESLRQQNDRPDEIIVGVDRSTDGSGNLARTLGVELCILVLRYGFRFFLQGMSPGGCGATPEWLRSGGCMKRVAPTAFERLRD